MPNRQCIARRRRIDSLLIALHIAVALAITIYMVHVELVNEYQIIIHSR